MAQGDETALELANSYASKLPENQMTVVTENGVFLMSKADEGLFDVIIMSLEYAEINDVSTAYSDSVTVLNVGEE